MSEKKPLTGEERRINWRSFIIGIFIGIAIIVLFTILYFVGLFR